MIETRNVPKVRLRPTMLSFTSTGKNRVLISGISRRSVARHKRIFATSNSPATPASARTGSGRDQSEPKRFLKLRFIVGVANAAHAALVRRDTENAGIRVRARRPPRQQESQAEVPGKQPQVHTCTKASGPVVCQPRVLHHKI